ncbi:XkdX family protein [Hazenella sp. IB182353]|nr:XkdX family protein [Polycladospora coralii]MBS7531380.1 XkdX family protein [Polycladospora coralii]
MSTLYDYFAMCWRYGTVTETQLQNAVVKGYISQEEYEAIIAL